MADTHDSNIDHDSDVNNEVARRIWSRAGVWGTLGILAVVLASVIFFLAQRERAPVLTPGQPRPAMAPST